ncbi:MAG: endolytic transglycosylase MltG [Gemmatimonadaceae bacterium]|nr:endolytic transglycosylase MltG [Gemmatimonadaceae bacterium]
MSRIKRATLACAAIIVTACGTPHGAPLRVIVPRGATFKSATDSLAHAGLVSWPKLFRAYARFTSSDRDIKPGTYLLKKDTPWKDILSALNGGKGLVNSITIPEGFSLQQIVPLLAKTLSVPEDSVNAAVRDTAMLSRLDIPTPTLEGYVFPSTYAFPAGTTARLAVSEMVREFERQWQPSWDARLSELKINRHDLVTMASIVEKEAKLAEERPVIAAVYYNRLRDGQLLQADPTVQYALGKHVTRVLYRDLEVESPYNTYRHAGLPPGPIASPGAASLAAAANPASVPYKYFVASADGHHEFRTTLREHDNAKKNARPPALTSAPTPDTTKKAAVATARAATTSGSKAKTTSRPTKKAPVIKATRKKRTTSTRKRA